MASLILSLETDSLQIFQTVMTNNAFCDTLNNSDLHNSLYKCDTMNCLSNYPIPRDSSYVRRTWSNSAYINMRKENKMDNLCFVLNFDRPLNIGRILTVFQRTLLQNIAT